MKRPNKLLKLKLNFIGIYIICQFIKKFNFFCIFIGVVSFFISVERLKDKAKLWDVGDQKTFFFHPNEKCDKKYFRHMR